MYRASLLLITICSSGMLWVSETRYLEVLVDERLQFIAHVRWVRQRVQNLVGALVKVVGTIGNSKRSLRKVYRALCLSVVTYGAPLWWHRRDVVPVRRHIDALQRPFLLAFPGARCRQKRFRFWQEFYP